MSSAAWTRKEGQDPAGGLNARGRAAYKAATGGTLRPPVKSGDDPRRASFLARMGAVRGPMVKDGKPTRLALALRAWGASSKEDARKKARAISRRLREGNQMKKIRSNPQMIKNPSGRITVKDLKGALVYLNRDLGLPEEPYSKTSDGRFRSNIGNIHLDQAYGGYKLTQMATDGGGVRELTGRGSAREIYDQIFAMRKGIEISGGRRNNPTKRKIKAVGRQSQATGRAPDKRLLRRRKKTVAGPRGFFANPVHTFKVLTRSKASAPFALVGSFKDKSRAMQYARAIHKASPTSLSVKVTN